MPVANGVLLTQPVYPNYSPVAAPVATSAPTAWATAGMATSPTAFAFTPTATLQAPSSLSTALPTAATLPAERFTPVVPATNAPVTSATTPSTFAPASRTLNSFPSTPLPVPMQPTRSALQVSSLGGAVKQEEPLTPKEPPKKGLKALLNKPLVRGALIMGTGFGVGMAGQVPGVELVLITLAVTGCGTILANGLQARSKVNALKNQPAEATKKAWHA